MKRKLSFLLSGIMVVSSLMGTPVKNIYADSSSTTRYEAENAIYKHANINTRNTASGGKYIGQIDYNDSYVDFTASVPSDGYYDVNIGYATTQNASHTLVINDTISQEVGYTSTGGWGQMGSTTTQVYLKKGKNSLKFMKGIYYAELDYIEIDTSIAGQKITQENFADGDFLGWSRYNGDANISQGKLTLSAANDDESKLVMLERNFKDFTISAGVSLDNGNGDAGFLFRATKVLDGLNKFNGYYVGVKTTNNGTVVVGKMKDGTYTELSSFSNLNINFLNTHTLTVTINDNNLSVSVDGTTIGSSISLTKDSDYNSTGSIGFRAYNTSMKYSNLKITETNLANQLNYTKNVSELTDNPFIPLKLGSVKPTGWLLNQLNLQKDGFTGNAEELYSSIEDLGSENGWLKGTSYPSWSGISEKAPYYLKGMIPLAYLLNDSGLKGKITKWVDYAVNSQLDNGNFGPSNLLSDYWSKMPMMYALKDYYEATNDPRIIKLFTRYFKYEKDELSNDANSSKLNGWAKARGADNIDIVLWLYNKTGDSDLLKLANIIERKMLDWTSIYTNNTFSDFQSGNNSWDFYPKHAVNVAEAFKAPAIQYQFTKAQADKNAFSDGMTTVLREHGQPYGMASGDEMLGGLSSTAGVETCAVVEQMQSNEEAQMILGSASIGDQLEQIAYNALPACFTKDLKEHEYYTQANQVISKEGCAKFDVDYYRGSVMSPVSGMGCCRFNMHMGWPYFVKNMWAATNDGGLGIMAYGPSTVTSYVGDNSMVTIDEVTNYPFNDTVTLNVSTTTSAKFPLKLRIPAWCSSPSITVNGVAQTGITSGEFYTIDRTWSNNDSVVITFPMNLVSKTGVNNSAYLMRGPLVYSLKLNENYTSTYDYSTGNSNLTGFNDYEISTDSNWNMALVLDRNNPSSNITVNDSGTMPSNPFVQSTTPVTLTAKAKQLGGWVLSANGRYAEEVPYSPVATSSSQVDVTLVPYGAEVLRVTEFPVVGTASYVSNSFTDNFASNTFTNWLNVGGSFNANNGSLNAGWVESAGGGKTAKAYVPNTNFANFTYDIDVKTANAGNSGVIFRANKVTKGANSFTGYYAGISPIDSKIYLGKCDGSDWTSLASASKTISANAYHHLKIEANGTTIKVYFDNETTPSINVTDNSYQAGTIGVRNYQSDAHFDNVSVNAISNNNPR